MRTFKGSTTEATSVILGAPFWSEGTKIAARYLRFFPSAVGKCDVFACPSTEVYVDERNHVVAPKTKGAKKITIDRFAMGSLTGYEMALQVAAEQGFDGFRAGDTVLISCTGLDPATEPGQSPMPKFDIEISRA